MNDLALFGIGSGIFAIYMFFLLRMIWKQHTIQQNMDSKILKVEPREPNIKAS